jgi:hypothetical protein
MNINSFWSDQGKWPKDTAGWTFLARAHNQIGKTLFDEHWTGKEPIERKPPLLDYCISDKYWQKIYAHTLLKKHRKDLKRKPLKFRSQGYIVPAFTQTQWDAAKELARKLHNEGKPAQERLHSVRNEIAVQCELEMLQSGSRAIDGGAIEPMPPELWNGERLTPRFERCQINLKEPFGLGIAGKEIRWIFITTESLNAFLKSLEKQKPTAKVKHTGLQVKDCLKWLIEQLQADNDLHKTTFDPHKTKGAYRKDAQEKFSIAFRAFDRVWAEAIKATNQDHKSNRGRKPKSKRVIDTPHAD